MGIIGRNAEIADLERLYSSERSEFVALYGRRRVGKTFLVNELLGGRFAFSHTALSSAETEGKELLKMQLQHFTHSLIKYGAEVNQIPDNWLDAFYMLERFLEACPKKRKVVFIDELPWLDTARSGFVTAFEAFWNNWAAKRKDVLLIVCGSAVSWVSDNLINGKGGLYDRLTSEIKLKPFTLKECEDFLKSKKISLDKYDTIQSYMIFGGIPYYLSLYTAGKSLAQNVDSLVFNENGKLRMEYDRLFASIFTNPDDAEKVIAALSSKRMGYTREELLRKTGLGNGGGFTKLLKSLVESDFIIKTRPYDAPEKKCRYRLTDNFCLFYRYFVSQNKTNDANFWQHSLNSPSINAWRGFAFENVCFQHIPQIKAALGISGVRCETYSWLGENGQIDLLIDRADRIINLCECKFSTKDFSVDKEYEKKLRERQAWFIEETKSKQPTIMTLITTFGLKANEYSGRFQSVITADNGLFYF